MKLQSVVIKSKYGSLVLCSFRLLPGLYSAALVLICFYFADASAAMQVRALKDYCNNYDLTSLNIKAGDIITVQTSNDSPPKHITLLHLFSPVSHNYLFSVMCVH